MGATGMTVCSIFEVNVRMLAMWDFSNRDGRLRYLPRVFRYLRPYWKLASVSAALIFVSALVGLLGPWPLKILIDSVMEGHPLPAAIGWILGPLQANRIPWLVFAVLAGLAITIAHNALTVLDNYVNTRLDQKISLDFRSDLFEHAQRLSLAYHERRRSGALIYALNSQSSAVSRVIMMVPPLAQSVLSLAGMFWITFHMDWKLAVLSLTVVPFLYYSVGYYITHVQTPLQKVRGLEAASLSIIHEAVSMMRVIVAFGRETHEHRRFRKQGEQAVDARVKLTVQQTLFTLAVNTTTAAGTALVLGFGAYSVLQGKLTVGQLLVVMAYIASVYQPLEAISTTVGSLQEVFSSLKVSFDLLETEPDINDAPGAISIERTKGRVTFENVAFSYKERVDTLKDISFDVPPGSVVALVGPTGAGKTTLISLLPRFYDGNGGRIMLDGIDIRQIKLADLRHQISIVLQEPLLFSTTIADNIRYGRLDASTEEIIEAAKAANAHDFIMALPKNYETELGERGATLSGGERQRIVVARAFLKNAPILILDEPTSSIDSKTEAVILDALDSLMVGRTTFMIAHRLSTIRRADVILVLDHGRLVGQGTHDHLLKANDLYRQLYHMQTRHEREPVKQR